MKTTLIIRNHILTTFLNKKIVSLLLLLLPLTLYAQRFSAQSLGKIITVNRLDDLPTNYTLDITIYGVDKKVDAIYFSGTVLSSTGSNNTIVNQILFFQIQSMTPLNNSMRLTLNLPKTIFKNPNTPSGGLSQSNTQGTSIYQLLFKEAVSPYPVTVSVNWALPPLPPSPIEEPKPVTYKYTKENNYILSTSTIEATTTINEDNRPKHLSTITYYDGLGRPIQEVAIANTPDKKDLVRPIVYDALGREDKQYLPYERTNTTGEFTATTTAIAGQLTYHNTLHGTTDGAYAYNQTHFEASPLNRVLKQAAPGKDWNARPQNFNYASNTAADAIKRWDVTSAAYGVSSIKYNDTYAANQLYVTQVTDEDGLITREFKNKQGQVVETQQVSGTITLRTSYVYDDLGNQRCVIPPLAQGLATTDANFNALTYQYAYNSRNLCRVKKLPDSDTVYLVYDSRDRLVFLQDGNLRAEKKWKAILYDALNRPVVEGLISSTLTHAQLEANCVGKFANQTLSGANYTFTSLNPDIPALSTTTALTQTYYDDYGWAPTGMPFTKTAFDLDTNLTNPKGQLTGTKVKVLDGNELTVNALWLHTAYYYDYKYRVIQLRREDYLGTANLTQIRTQYSFDGLPLQVQESYASKDTINTYYEYDHARRVSKTYQQINGQTKQLLATYTYDALGRQTNKLLGNSENVSYAYNIRNWLTGINAGNIANENSKFAMKLYYNDAPTGSVKRYNGNIAATDWKHFGVPAKQTYSYTYDGFNRLSAGMHGGNYNEKDITYDANGNIAKLVRQGGDNAATYTYTYNGNQLKTLNKLAYAYDNNGNMITDGLRGMTIKYNVVNLPKEISKGAEKLEYIYSATGDKLAKKFKGIFTQFYTLSVVYKSDKTVEYVMHSEGIAHNTTSKQYAYQYNLTDHLGNVRVVLDQSKTVVQKTDYYPFGLAHLVANTNKNKYLYNGKELQDEVIGGSQLNQFDVEARFYDPVLGRTTTPDPHAENYYAWSPYHFVANNPVRITDPNGMDWYSIEEKYKEDGKEKTRRIYHYSEKYRSQKDLKKAGIDGKYEGITAKTEDAYYSLLGETFSLKNSNGTTNYEAEVIEILDNAIMKPYKNLYKAQSDPFNLEVTGDDVSMDISAPHSRNTSVILSNYAGGDISFYNTTEKNKRGYIKWGSGKYGSMGGYFVKLPDGVYARMVNSKVEWDNLFWRFNTVNSYNNVRNKVEKLLSNRKL